MSNTLSLSVWYVEEVFLENLRADCHCHVGMHGSHQVTVLMSPYKQDVWTNMSSSSQVGSKKGLPRCNNGLVQNGVCGYWILVYGFRNSCKVKISSEIGYSPYYHQNRGHWTVVAAGGIVRNEAR